LDVGSIYTESQFFMRFPSFHCCTVLFKITTPFTNSIFPYWRAMGRNFYIWFLTGFRRPRSPDPYYFGNFARNEQFAPESQICKLQTDHQTAARCSHHHILHNTTRCVSLTISVSQDYASTKSQRAGIHAGNPLSGDPEKTIYPHGVPAVHLKVGAASMPITEPSNIARILRKEIFLNSESEHHKSD